MEEVRVGLLSFQREIEELQKSINTRREELKDAISQKRELGRSISLGRRLLEINDRITDLEQVLLIGNNTNGSNSESDLEDVTSDEDESDEEHETTDESPLAKRIRRHIKQYQIAQKLINIYSSHPFVESQRPRLEKIRSTLLLDLQTLQKQKGEAAVTELEKILNSNHRTEIPIR